VVPSIERGNRANGGCDRSTGDAYSSMAPDPTSDVFGGPCTPILCFVFPFRLTRLITDRYFCHFIHVPIIIGQIVKSERETNNTLIHAKHRIVKDK
jgi:hypothetical protein